MRRFLKTFTMSGKKPGRALTRTISSATTTWQRGATIYAIYERASGFHTTASKEKLSFFERSGTVRVCLTLFRYLCFVLYLRGCDSIESDGDPAHALIILTQDM